MKNRNLLWGLLMILAAVLIIMNQFGFLEGVNIFGIVLSVIMVGVIIVSVKHINFWGILFPVAIICIIYANELNITKFTPWPALLTALLLSIGLSLIFNRNHCGLFFTCNKHDFHSRVENEEDGNVVNCSTNFGEIIKYVNTENFEKANIKCSFGEIKLYFDHAKIPSGTANIFIDVSFGEVVLFLPSTWRVINETNSFFGEMNEKRCPIQAESPVVTIRGNINFGETTIIYV